MSLLAVLQDKFATPIRGLVAEANDSKFAPLWTAALAVSRIKLSLHLEIELYDLCGLVPHPFGFFDIIMETFHRMLELAIGLVYSKFLGHVLEHLGTLRM